MDGLPVTTLVALLGFAGGIVLGAVARAMQFCTLGAIADAFLTTDHRRLRAWALAIATATLTTQTLHMTGVVDIYQSIYLVPDFGWLGAIIGGLCFGFGMALVGTCAYGSMVRLGGGDLKALVDFLVLGIVAYATLRGLSGMGRVYVIEAANAALSGIGNQGIPDALAWLLAVDVTLVRALLVTAMVAALALYCFKDPAFRRSRRDVAGGAIIGLLIAFGWIATGVAGADPFEPTALASFTFVAPVGRALVYVMTFSGATINFGIASVGGVIVGAFLASRGRRDFRLEAFDDEKEMLRHLAGAAMMGFGGVLAMGCTIGQGITGLSTLSLSAPLALGSIFIGAYFGLKYLIEGSLRGVLRSGFARY